MINEYFEEIQSAIRQESYEYPKYIELEIFQKKRDGRIWIIEYVKPNNNIEIDSSFEGTKVYWIIDGFKCYGEILSSIPEDREIHIRYATHEPPDPEKKIVLFPPRYIEALQDIWQKKTDWTNLSLEWYDEVESCIINQGSKQIHLDNSNFPNLRSKQRDAFKLVDYNFSFLNGPPGTGKTYTLGAIISQYLLQHQNAKILLLSSTNVATDQALVSVDDHLINIDTNSNIRNKCKRLGGNFNSHYYKERNHLLADVDENLLSRLIFLEANPPDKKNANEYANWKEEIERLKKEIKNSQLNLISESRLIAMTATRCLFLLEELKQFHFDLIVFDESSQLSRIHAITLSLLGDKVLFTGDPKQLSPISLSNNEKPKEWLGNSMFWFESHYSTSSIFLDEQSRMISQINDLISNLFYNNKLKVCNFSSNNRSWTDFRKLKNNSKFNKSLLLIDVGEEATYSQKYNGNIRFKSAEAIKEVCLYLIQEEKMNPQEIAILTPFRAQKKLIKVFFRNDKILKYIRISTVHAAQGSEFHTVIFDLVNESNNFLLKSKNRDAGRIINVALSRAKARNIIFSARDNTVNGIMNNVRSYISKNGIIL